MFVLYYGAFPVIVRSVRASLLQSHRPAPILDRCFSLIKDEALSKDPRLSFEMIQMMILIMTATAYGVTMPSSCCLTPASRNTARATASASARLLLLDSLVHLPPPAHLPSAQSPPKHDTARRAAMPTCAGKQRSGPARAGCTKVMRIPSLCLRINITPGCAGAPSGLASLS